MEKLDIYVSRTLESGVLPIELKFRPVYDCFGGRVTAYRGQSFINSIVYGVLTPKEYDKAVDMSETGVALAMADLKKAFKAAELLRRKYVRFEWVSVRCPSYMLLEKDLYSRLKKLAVGENFAHPELICLEFGEDVLTLGGDSRKGFSDVKAMGFKTAIRGFGEDTFSVASLIDFTPNVVFMSERLIDLLKDRNKAAVMPSFVRVAKSLGIQAVACGIENDDQIREIGRVEALGFLPAENYKGNVPAESKFFGIGELTALAEVV